MKKNTYPTTSLPSKTGDVEERSRSSALPAQVVAEEVVELEQFQVVVRALKDLLLEFPISSDPSAISAIQQARVLVNRYHKLL
jgi:hypothetical protein